ncbi:Serine/threonine-protein kinase ppk15 [Morella rubra]|uniref:Serine/threonine-protein kinase ppk15 n=1 Tax=Morella rubra TaxID=262757 RepID=A0A6A1W035_9ROSI|nr:Serine/threonine-protein kinase ppk15 [Morella rubra]KAB1217686.1 Serine/threonine-protein kinase ppk15 [Morella rubra]
MVSHVEAVLEFLKKNGLSEAETALKEDMIEKGELGSFDFEKFFFPMVPPPRPLRIPSNHRRSEIAGSGESVRSNPRSEDDEFVSLGSSTSDGCSSGTSFHRVYANLCVDNMHRKYMFLVCSIFVMLSSLVSKMTEKNKKRYVHTTQIPSKAVARQNFGLIDLNEFSAINQASFHCTRISALFYTGALSKVSTNAEFINPYGIRSTSPDTAASSGNLSQFGTARDYHDFDMQNDLFWYDEKEDGAFMTPCFEGPDFFGCPTEDKFVMMPEKEKECANLQEKKCLFYVAPLNDENEVHVVDYDHFERNCEPGEGIQGETKGFAAYSRPLPICKCSVGAGGFCAGNPADESHLSSKETDLTDLQLEVVGDIPTYCETAAQNKKNNAVYSAKRGSINYCVEGFKDSPDLNIKAAEEDFNPNGIDSYEFGDGGKLNAEHHKTDAAAEGEDFTDERLLSDICEEEYEVFDLRIIHRKNRTGFEENKDLPIVLNTVIAGRYYVTEYLGSAAFSKVVQAHDLHNGIDVCLKIIKNDKDFFDQSLDEIKLLKLVNKHDPADERHILRLYDFFYHQEHLFIVCELLRSNLYEFQKFNEESGGEAYFTLRRLQVITRQCLEALEYLHRLGIIHCDLKPENILIKSYRRCEIKVIDLGSSCFQTDNLCLYVQSRSYRAPEVILGLPYDQRIDIWSLGCILAELCSGEVLFPNDSVVMILARMIGMLGPIDMEMLEQGQETHKYFSKEYDLYHINEETDQLEYIIPESSSLERRLRVTDIGFIDFVKYLLEINPKRRPTAVEALEHPWLSYSY